MNLAEIQIGQLASKQGATEGVKKFGQRLVIDHTRLEDELKPIAAKIGLTPPTELAPGDQTLLGKLQGQSGSEFDDTFIHAMVKGHQEAIQLYKTEETSGQDPTVKNAARYGEPVIAEHLKLAEHLQGGTGKS
ncbi:putative outer membrane protein [Tunturiibacter psychrotolerans]